MNSTLTWAWGCKISIQTPLLGFPDLRLHWFWVSVGLVSSSVPRRLRKCKDAEPQWWNAGAKALGSEGGKLLTRKTGGQWDTPPKRKMPSEVTVTMETEMGQPRPQ